MEHKGYRKRTAEANIKKTPAFLRAMKAGVLYAISQIPK